MAVADEIEKLLSGYSFDNPVSGSKPGSEAELSAVLALRFREISWDKVPLHRIGDDGATTGNMGSLIDTAEPIISEYPLDHASEKELNIWGAMRIDHVHVACGDTILFIESKLDDKQTHGKDQFKLYVNYLRAKPLSRYTQRWFILLCIENHWKRGWLVKDMERLNADAESLDPAVNFGVVFWDDIIRNLQG